METDEQIKQNTLPTQPRRFKIRWWGWLLIAFGLMDALVSGVIIGGVYLFYYLPHQYEDSTRGPQWAASNIRYVNFNKPEIFQRAQKRLSTLAFTPEGMQDPVPRLLLANLFNAMGEKSAALHFYREVLAITKKNLWNRAAMSPLSYQAHEELALLYYELGRKEDALRELAALWHLDSSPENADLLYALQDRLEEPDRADFRLELAYQLKANWQLKLARQEAEAALSLSRSPSLNFKTTAFLKNELPVDANQLSALDEYYLMRGHYYQGYSVKKSTGAFKQAISRKPDSEWAYLGLAIAYDDINDDEKAEKAARKSVALNPNSYYGHHLLGNLARKRKNYPEALAHFQKERALLETFPIDDDYDRINVENQLAYTYELSKDYRQALTYYSNAVRVAQSGDSGSGDNYEYAREGEIRMRKLLGLSSD